MKFKNDHLHEYDSHIDVHELEDGSIDHSGVLVASLFALIIILIGALSSDMDLLSFYFSN